MDAATQYPVASREELRSNFLGRNLVDLPCPIAVIDRHVAGRNCRRMAEACKELNVLFRAHIKTSKTVELAALEQQDEKHVNFVVSTVAEAEFIKDYLLEVKKEGRTVNVLYGFPIPPSMVNRMAKLGKILGPGSITLLVDNVAHIEILHKFKDIAGFGPYIMFKLDAGYHRAGIPATEDELGELVAAAVQAEQNGFCRIHGVYSHSGHSYSGESPEDGMRYLLEELQEIAKGATIVRKYLQLIENRRLVVSVGASPSATSVRNLLGEEDKSDVANSLRRTFKETFDDGISIELHAGVYALLDIQQLNIQSTLSSTDQVRSPIIPEDIGLSILAEVASIYPRRDPPQALIAAGALALGREPCPGYPGWAIVSAWGLVRFTSAASVFSGWEVGKISQEHGLLYASQDSRVRDIGARSGPFTATEAMPFKVGQKVRLWPNHACIAAANFGFFAIVDSSSEDPDEVIDIWIRCRGW